MNLDINPENPKESQRTSSRSRSRLQTNRTRGLQSRLSALGERSAEYNERGEHIWCVSNLVIKNCISCSFDNYGLANLVGHL